MAGINYDSIFPGKQQQLPPASTSGGAGSGSDSTGQSDSGYHSAGESLAAGVMQGAIRDPAQTITSVAAPVINWVDQNVPFLGALDRWAGTTPEAIAAKTADVQQKYGGDLSFQAGRVGGNVLAGAAIPGGAAVEGAANALNLGRLGAAAARGAYAGGTGSALTAGGYGENPLVAGAEGAVGGGLLGAGTAAVMRPVASTLTNIADRLGIELTAGQKNAGGIITRLEDLSGPLPGSGAGKKATQQQGQMANVIQRNMGVPETGGFTLPEAQVARRAAGTEMGNVAGTMNIDSRVPAGAPAAGGGAAPNLVDRLNQIVSDAESLGPRTEQAYGARNLRQQIMNSLARNGGVMPGNDFQRFISNASILDNMASHDSSAVQDVASKVRGALMTAANNTPSNPPGVLDAFKAAQLKYKASLLATEATKESGDFATVTPAKLKQLIYRMYDDQMGNTGAGYDIPDLARLIRAIPKMASSGTAERSMLYNALLSGGAGALGYLSTPTALSAGIHAAVPYAALTAAGRMSRFGPGMGVPYVGNALAAVGNYANPVLPRIAGEGVGKAVTGNWTWPQQ